MMLKSTRSLCSSFSRRATTPVRAVPRIRIIGATGRASMQTSSMRKSLVPQRTMMINQSSCSKTLMQNARCSMPTSRLTSSQQHVRQFSSKFSSQQAYNTMNLKNNNNNNNNNNYINGIFSRSTGLATSIVRSVRASGDLNTILKTRMRAGLPTIRTDITYKYSKEKPTRDVEDIDFKYPTNQADDYGIVPGETLIFDNSKTRLIMDYDILMTDKAMGPDAIMPWESYKMRFINGMAFWLPFLLLFIGVIIWDPLKNQIMAPYEKPFHCLRAEYGNEPIYIEEGYPENKGYAAVREKIKERRISELSNN